MRFARIVFSAAALAGLSLAAAPAQPSDMKATAPDKMVRPSDAGKMRACDKKAMQLKIPMAEHAAFVKKCMEKMK
jgi:hypothetical protein